MIYARRLKECRHLRHRGKLKHDAERHQKPDNTEPTDRQKVWFNRPIADLLDVHVASGFCASCWVMHTPGQRRGCCAPSEDPRAAEAAGVVDEGGVGVPVAPLARHRDVYTMAPIYTSLGSSRCAPISKSTPICFLPPRP